MVGVGCYRKRSGARRSLVRRLAAVVVLFATLLPAFAVAWGDAIARAASGADAAVHGAVGGASRAPGAGGAGCPIRRVPKLPEASAMERLRAWLAANGADLSAVYVDGRTLRASRALAAGERVFLVPGLLTLCPETAARCGAGGPAFMAQLGTRMESAGFHLRVPGPQPPPLEAYAILLANEMIAGEASAWAPYIDVMPRRAELPATAMLWTDAAVAELATLNDGNETSRMYAALSTLWKQKASNVVQFLLQHAPELWPGVDGATLRELGEVATVRGQSRLWDSRHNEHSHKVGAPLADMLNHRTGANTVDELRACGALGLDGAPCRVLSSPHAVAAGDELFTPYVNPLAYDGNTHLVHTYGFLEMANAGVTPESLTFRFPDMATGPQRDDYLLARASFFRDTASPALSTKHLLGAGPLGRLRLETLQFLRATSLLSLPDSVDFRGVVDGRSWLCCGSRGAGRREPQRTWRPLRASSGGKKERRETQLQR